MIQCQTSVGCRGPGCPNIFMDLAVGGKFGANSHWWALAIQMWVQPFAYTYAHVNIPDLHTTCITCNHIWFHKPLEVFRIVQTFSTHHALRLCIFSTHIYHMFTHHAHQHTSEYSMLSTHALQHINKTFTHLQDPFVFWAFQVHHVTSLNILLQKHCPSFILLSFAFISLSFCISLLFYLIFIFFMFWICIFLFMSFRLLFQIFSNLFTFMYLWYHSILK